MAIDKIFNNANVDGIADNIFGSVNNSVSEVKQMQQRKAAENVQMVVEAFKKIETNITEKFDNVSNVIEKRVLTIKDGRDGINGKDGRDGKDGRNGKDGLNGKPGLQGPPGKDGIDGTDGVSVTDANIDFDGSLIINLSSGKQINAGEIISPELEKKIISVQHGGSSGSGGDVMGPTSATDNRIARFDGTTGKLIQNSAVTINDSGNVSGVGTLSASGVATLSAGAVIQGLTVGLGAGAVSGNTAVGLTALNVNTTGSQNTAVGELTLAGNLGGTSNTAIGSTALTSNTSGNQNTAVGLLAARSTTTGSDNVAIGSTALYSNTTFSGNIAIGSGALYSANGGSNSTVIGYSAGTTAYGGTNTFLGYSSGSAVTSGANNVIIGGYTGSAAPISATGSNYIVLSDGAGTVRQTIDSTGKVGFGTTAPNAALEVSGSNNSIWSAATSTISGVTLTVGAVSGTAIAIGDLVYGTGVQPYTRITAGSGSSWTVSVFQTVASTTLVGGPTYANTLIRITDTDTSQNTNQPTGGLQFYSSDTSSPTAGVGAYVAAMAETNTPDTALVFGTRDNVGGGVDANERMRIDSAGNVGINITAPTAKLHVDGNAIISTTDNTNAALRITQLGTGNALLVEDSTNPDSSPVLVDANGQIVQGYTVAVNNWNGAPDKIQSHATASNALPSVGLFNWSNNTARIPGFYLYKSVSNTIGTQGAVANLQALGRLVFSGDDGATFIRAAEIDAFVDGTPGLNDMPGALRFNTTPDGASAPIERVRIDSAGNVGIGATANASAILDAQSTTKGVRMPNMTTTQKNAIASPAAGLMVFDTTLAKLCVYSGTAWQTITSV